MAAKEPRPAHKSANPALQRSFVSATKTTIPTNAVIVPPRDEARYTTEAIAGIGTIASPLTTWLRLEMAVWSSSGTPSATKIASPFQYPSGKLSRFATLGS